MRSLVGSFLRRCVYGRKRFEPAFRVLHHYAVTGLFAVGSGYAGTGEIAVLENLKSVLPRDPIILDVGANVGDYATAVLAAFPGASLHCFEPLPPTYALLEKRLGRDPRVQLHPVGIGDESGSRAIYSNGEPGDPLASLHAGRGPGSARAVIEVRRLDEMAAELGIERVDFLKIDAEGNELAVLRGAGGLLDGVSAIQFEFGDANISSRTFLRDFYDLLGGEFDLFRVTRDGLLTLGDYSPEVEIFVTANYLARRKAHR